MTRLILPIPRRVTVRVVWIFDGKDVSTCYTSRMKKLLIALLTCLIYGCSGIVDLRVSGNAETGIVFELAEKDAKKLNGRFRFHVLDYSDISAGQLRETMWEFRSEQKRQWFLFFKRWQVASWQYGELQTGFIESVKPKPLKMNTLYMYSIKGGPDGGLGCFYLDDKREVISNDNCKMPEPKKD